MKVISFLKNSTDQTMITLFRDQMTANQKELAASREESKNQFALIQQQMNSFQTLIAGLMKNPENKNMNPLATENATPTTSNLEKPPTEVNEEEDSSNSDNETTPELLKTPT
jgi:glycosidase